MAKIRCKKCASGLACDRPHGVSRYQRCGCRCDTCTAETSAAGRAYYAANKEAVKAKRRAYAAANPEKVREAQQRYAANHRDRLNEYGRQYRRANRDSEAERNRVWREENPELYQQQLALRRDRRRRARASIAAVDRLAPTPVPPREKRGGRHRALRAGQSDSDAARRQDISERMRATFASHAELYREDESA